MVVVVLRQPLHVPGPDANSLPAAATSAEVACHISVRFVEHANAHCSAA